MIGAKVDQDPAVEAKRTVRFDEVWSKACRVAMAAFVCTVALLVELELEVLEVLDVLPLLVVLAVLPLLPVVLDVLPLLAVLELSQLPFTHAPPEPRICTIGRTTRPIPRATCSPPRRATPRPKCFPSPTGSSIT